MQAVDCFLCASAAWAAAALLTHMTVRQAAVNGGIAGLICALLALLLPVAGITVPLTLPVMLLLALLLPVLQRVTWSSRAMLLFLTVGLWALLDSCAKAFHSLFSPFSAVVSQLVLIGLFLALAWVLRRRFPEEGWADSFTGPEHRSIRPWYVWTALGLMTLAELSLRYLIPQPKTVLGAAALLGGYSLLFWGSLGGVSLLVAYRQERVTTLVDQDYRNEVQSFMSVIRSQRHDYNFHVQALAGLINGGDLEECRRYVNNLVKDSVSMNTLLPVKDPAIAALIFSFRSMAQENGIELHLDIQNDLSSVVTSVYETNKVIGNLLQNAIDEVKTHKDKSFGIHLYILKRGENCIIHVANRIRPVEDQAAHMEEIYKPGHSTKEGHEGIGLNSIQNLLRRHRGVVYSRIEDDIIHFIAKIPMELQGGVL